MGPQRQNQPLSGLRPEDGKFKARLDNLGTPSPTQESQNLDSEHLGPVAEGRGRGPSRQAALLSLGILLES